MTELAWRELTDGLAVCCTIIGGPSAVITAGDQRYILNQNQQQDWSGSLYPVRLLECFRPPARVPVFDRHLNQRWTNQQDRQHLGWCRHIHWHRPSSSLRGWLYPFRSALARLLEYEQTQLDVISGSYELDPFEPLTVDDQRWKLVRQFQLKSVDLVDQSTAGGRLLTQRDINYKIVRIRHDQKRAITDPV